MEFSVDFSSFALGKRVQDIAPLLPEKCILVSINRSGHVLIPHGGTVLEEGDRVTAFVSSGDEDSFTASMSQGLQPSIAE